MDEKVTNNINVFSERVKKMLPVKMIILYGSYAKGTYGTDSDIDIALVVDELKENWLKVNSQLFLLSAEIDSNIEPNLIISRDRKSTFLESILRYGIVIYDASKAA